MNMEELNALLMEIEQIMESGHGKFNYWSEKTVSKNKYITLKTQIIMKMNEMTII